MKRKMLIFVVLLLVTSLVIGCTAQQATQAPTEAVAEPVADTPATVAPTEEVAAVPTEPEPVVHSSEGDFTYNTPPGRQINVAEFFQIYGLDVKSMVTSTGGDVSVSAAPSQLPTPKEEFVLGLAIHNTSDIVGKVKEVLANKK